MNAWCLAVCVCVLAVSSNAFAAVCKPVVTVNFAEGAPTDAVEIRHESIEGWQLRSLVWALEGSAGDLIFDTVRGGAGYDVAQPFNGSGSAALSMTPELRDGDRLLSLSFEDFPATSFYRFTLDVDDRVSASRGTMISGAEIAGSTVSVVMEDPSGQTVSMNGFFDQNSMAILSASCQN